VTNYMSVRIGQQVHFTLHAIKPLTGPSAADFANGQSLPRGAGSVIVPVAVRDRSPGVMCRTERRMAPIDCWNASRNDKAKRGGLHNLTQRVVA